MWCAHLHFLNKPAPERYRQCKIVKHILPDGDALEAKLAARRVNFSGLDLEELADGLLDERRRSRGEEHACAADARPNPIRRDGIHLKKISQRLSRRGLHGYPRTPGVAAHEEPADLA